MPESYYHQICLVTMTPALKILLVHFYTAKDFSSPNKKEKTRFVFIHSVLPHRQKIASKLTEVKFMSSTAQRP